jgi:hypothetical protein
MFINHNRLELFQWGNMAARLTDTWNLHAFSDEGLEKEQVWAEESEQSRDAVRQEIYLEHAGLRQRKFTRENPNRENSKAAKSRALDSMMLLAVGSPAYIEAYNNELSFTINGEDFEITQGELYDRAKQRAGDLRDQIDDAKRRGASTEEITRLQHDLDAHRIIRDNADPQLGKVTPDRQQAIRDAIAGSGDVQNTLRQESKVTGASAKTDEENRMDRGDKGYAVKDEWTSTNIRASFAASIENPESDPAISFLAKEFAKATEDQPAVPETQPDPAEPNKTPGLTF